MNRYFILPLLLFGLLTQAQQKDPFITKDFKEQQLWVDQTLSSMSLDQKIGQLFMFNAYSDKRMNPKFVKKMIRKYHIGGLIFFQGTPEQQAELYNSYQSKSKIPLIVGFDGEWGLDMRLDNTFKYPFNMTLGAISNNALIEAFGRQIGLHHKRIGIQINFAPVVDINTNPANPIIGNRSFGENKVNVSQKAEAFIKGIQSVGVISNAKHFPGHGDTSTDSHKTLPFLDFDLARLDSIELYPYYRLMDTGLGSVMVGHLNVPALETEENLPTSLSYKVVTELLQEDMGFKGLVFTDALNMKGAANYGSPGAVDLKAFMAGNDMLLYSNDVEAGFKSIKKAFKEGQFSMDRLDKSVRKILKAKYWAGLNDYHKIPIGGIAQDIHTPKDDALKEELFANAITLVKDKNRALPIYDLNNKKTAYIHLGDVSGEAFYERLNSYESVDQLSFEDPDLLEELKNYDRVIIGFHKSDEKFWKSYKFSEKELQQLNQLAKGPNTILCVFTSPYALLQIEDFSEIETIVVSYQNDEVAQGLTAEILYGARAAQGHLPVSIGISFKEGTGLRSIAIQRLGFASPSAVGVDAEKLKEVDQLMEKVIDSAMAPGLVVLAARNGKVFYQKSKGKLVYDGVSSVNNNTVYDLASLTKVLGGLPMMIKAEQDGYYSLDDRLGEVFEVLEGSNKEKISMKEALSHVGRLKAWIPFFKETLDSVSHQPMDVYYRSEFSQEYAIKVAEDLYLLTSYKDSIYDKIADSSLREEEGYKYSGLLFYLIPQYIESLYGKEFSTLNESLFYDQLGAESLGYLPLEEMSNENIAPSEMDDYFRHQELQGYVHDMGAAMMGGVSGNAGLFGNALDVAKMMQMFLQGGYYGGHQYLRTSELQKFTKAYYTEDLVRRGLGFDKPSLDPEISSSAVSASELSFGHSGFTGTFAWADPATGLVYIFLSNRVYPSMENNKLSESDMRTRIHEAFYEALMN
ncbi:MAG: glycoside hydrolase family 3 N-terminal domain-containing protein [Flavobacteriaceae bacterium]